MEHISPCKMRDSTQIPGGRIAMRSSWKVGGLGLAVLLGAGCADRGRGEKPVLGAEQLYLDATNQTLPPAVVGQPYTAQLLVQGGEPPYTWFDPDFSLPQGLALVPEGRIEGTPVAAGEY